MMETNSTWIQSFEAQTRAEPEAVERNLAAIMGAPSRQRPRARGRPLVWGAATMGLAIAAAALLLVMPTEKPPPMPLAMDLSLHASGDVVEPVEGVRLTLSGTGQLGGTTAHPELDWSRGQVHVSVEPGSLDGLTVRTGEGEVRITGTVFSVDRTALGTRVSVERGSVAVACEMGDQHALQAGDEQVCLPTSAGGMLGRAQALEQAGAAAGDVLAALDAGLAMSAGPAVVTELQFRRAVVLRQQGDLSGAWQQVSTALANGGGVRRDALRRFAAEVALTIRDCSGAEPYLDTVVEDAVYQPLVDACSVER